MDFKQKPLGIPVFIWLLAIALIGTVVGATVISNILSRTTNLTGGTPVQISWNQQIPTSTTVGQTYNWAITTSASSSYTAALVIDVAAGIPLSDPTVVTVTAGSQATGARGVTLTAQSNGHLEGQTSSVTVPSGTNVAQFIGTWIFNSNAPSTSYSIQVWFQV